MNPSPKIKAALTIYNSRCDFYGNCYYAFSYCDTLTGKYVHGHTASANNVRYILGHMSPLGIDNGEYHISTQEMPIREFNRFTKEFPYAGCSPDDIAKFIQTELAKQV